MVQYPDQQSLEGSNNGRVEVLCLKVRLLLGLGFYEITHTLHRLSTHIMIVIWGSNDEEINEFIYLIEIETMDTTRVNKNHTSTKKYMPLEPLFGYEIHCVYDTMTPQDKTGYTLPSFSFKIKLHFRATKVDETRTLLPVYRHTTGLRTRVYTHTHTHTHNSWVQVYIQTHMPYTLHVHKSEPISGRPAMPWHIYGCTQLS